MKINNLYLFMVMSINIMMTFSGYSEDGMMFDHEISKTTLANIPPSIVETMAVSPDGRHIAYPYKIGDMWYIGGNVDSCQPHAVDRIIPESIQFSEDSKKIAYVAEIDDRFIACSHNNITQKFDEIKNNKIYINNHGMYAASFIVSIDGKMCSILWNIDNKGDLNYLKIVKKGYDDIKMFSGPIIFYKSDNKWSVSKSDLFSKYDDILEILFYSRECSLFKCIYDKKETLFFNNNKISLSVQKITAVGINNLNIGSRNYLSYSYIDENGKCNLKIGYIDSRHFVETSEFINFDDIKLCTGIEKLVWCDKEKRLAVKAKFDNKYLVLINKEKGPLYDDIGEIIFSPDGKHYAYSAKSDNKWFVVTDGKEGKKYRKVANLVYNNENTYLAYMVQHDENDDKYWSSKYKPNDLWGLVINDYHSMKIYVNKFFTKVIFDKENEFHLISGIYLTTTEQEKRQEYTVELKSYNIEKIILNKEEPAKPENKVY